MNIININKIEFPKFFDNMYMASSHMFTGLEIGILFGSFFKIDEDDLDKMTIYELYVSLVIELCFMAVIIYFYGRIFNYFGSPFNGWNGYDRNSHTDNVTESLFAISLLVGNRNISEKVRTIIEKSGFFHLKK